jgi:hypothetical protein
MHSDVHSSDERNRQPVVPDCILRRNRVQWDPMSNELVTAITIIIA